jgi:hypothetical protein
MFEFSRGPRRLAVTLVVSALLLGTGFAVPSSILSPPVRCAP